MNAKKLLETAQSWLNNVESDSEVTGLMEHILDTVKPDDDEPLDNMFINSIMPFSLMYGWKITNLLSIWSFSEGYSLYFTDGEGDTNPIKLCVITTRGQLRQLLKLMGAEVKS